MKQALIVLGMHRSGTSAVAGALAKLGAATPASLMQETADNPKGYWESERLVRMNDRILESAGSSWHDWRPFNADWIGTPAGKALLDELIEAVQVDFGGAALILLKDPRICRLFPVWRAALTKIGYAPVVLSPLRRPAEVAASLARRDGFSQGRGYLMWLRHVLEAEAASRDLPRLIFRWSDFLTDWRSILDLARLETGLALPARSDFSEHQVDEFLDSDLRRERKGQQAPSNAPPWVQPTLDALLALSITPGDPAALDALDAIRAEFDSTAAVYGPAFVGVETEYYALGARYQDRIRELEADLNDARQGAAAIEQARLETEIGWRDERRRLEAIEDARLEAETRAADLGHLLNQERERLSSAMVREIALTEEVARLTAVEVELNGRLLRAAQECRTASLQNSEAQAALAAAKMAEARSSRDLQLFRSRLTGRPIRTAWTLLSGRAAGLAQQA